MLRDGKQELLEHPYLSHVCHIHILLNLGKKTLSYLVINPCFISVALSVLRCVFFLVKNACFGLNGYVSLSDSAAVVRGHGHVLAV